MIFRRSSSLLVLAAMAFPLTLAAQELPAATRSMIVESLEGDRDMALSILDSMPEHLLRFKPVPEVRDFAQQIDHVATSAAFLVARFVLEESPPELGDPTVYLNDKDGLRQVVDAAFNYCLTQLRTLPDTTLLQPTRIFGNEVPKWRVFMMIHSHDVWTLGQVVPYFRLNGMPPPAFAAF
ncbi:MAG: DinB family protein [Gemmatimonadetes bacterium]|nr:DinB family protein [Gemmatimonadota bacterium]